MSTTPRQKSPSRPLTSRQRVLEYLQAHRVATIAELAAALRMTEANVRHHLSILQELGLAGPAGQRSSGSKGRPARLFGPSERLLGDNLANLASALLAEWTVSPEPSEKASLAVRLARRLADGMAAQPGTARGQGLSTRIRQAIQQLNGCNYQARWEAHTSGPHLILGHCPYRLVLERNPEICQVDAALLELLLSTPVEETARLLPAADGLPVCIFAVRSPR